MTKELQLKSGDRFLYYYNSSLHQEIFEAIIEEITPGRNVKVKHIRTDGGSYIKWHTQLEKQITVVEVLENLHKKERLNEIGKI